MATELPYTLATLLSRIHTLYQNDNSVPASTDDQYAIYLTLVNQAIGDWAETQDVFWNELWKVYNTVDPVKVGQTAYPLSTTDLRIPSSLVRFYTAGNPTPQVLQVVEPSDVIKYNGVGRVVYFTGNPGIGYTLNLGWTPAAGDGLLGATIQFDGQKTANTLVNSTDAPEMSDPNYIIWSAASMLNLLDGNSNLYSVYSQKMMDCMDNMRIRNEQKPINSDMRPDDVDLITQNSAFGF